MASIPLPRLRRWWHSLSRMMKVVLESGAAASPSSSSSFLRRNARAVLIRKIGGRGGRQRAEDPLLLLLLLIRRSGFLFWESGEHTLPRYLTTYYLPPQWGCTTYCRRRLVGLSVEEHDPFPSVVVRRGGKRGVRKHWRSPLPLSY